MTFERLEQLIGEGFMCRLGKHAVSNQPKKHELIAYENGIQVNKRKLKHTRLHLKVKLFLLVSDEDTQFQH